MVKAQKEKRKAKEWYTMLAPKMFGEIKIGDTFTDDTSKLIGRRMEVPLSDLIGSSDIKNYNLKLLLQISDVDHNNAYTKLVGHEINRDYLRSLVRRRSSKVNLNIEVLTMDRYSLRVKLSCFTLKKANDSQVKMIRQIAEETVKNRANGLGFNNYMQEIILGKMAADIYKNAKKIYPLRRVEVNKTEVISAPAQA